MKVLVVDDSEINLKIVEQNINEMEEISDKKVYSLLFYVTHGTFSGVRRCQYVGLRST